MPSSRSSSLSSFPSTASSLSAFSSSSIRHLILSSSMISLLSLVVCHVTASENNGREPLAHSNNFAPNYLIPPHLVNRFVAEKKSEPALMDVMSAMNEAPRLRYGKRAAMLSADSDYYPEYFRLPSRWSTMKRAVAFSDNLPAIIDSLNGAERLRQ